MTCLVGKQIIDEDSFVWNLGSLSYFIFFVRARLVVKKNTTGDKSNADRIYTTLRSVQVWWPPPVLRPLRSGGVSSASIGERRAFIVPRL